jgi:uncharacterized protein
MPTLTLDPFRPQVINAHLQTILANVLRTGHGLAWRRERLELPDGDFVDLDWPTAASHPLPATAPLVLVLHGLEGNARRGYACELYRHLAANGLRGVGMNFRSCSGEMNRTRWLYNAGATADVGHVVRHLERLEPSTPKAIVGYSLGGNMALKFMGEEGAGLAENVRAAVAISPPLRMWIGSKALETPLGRLYGRRLLKSLHTKVRTKAHLLAGHVDVPRVLATRSLYEFDEVATAPLYGYNSADDYYRQCSSAGFVGGIQRPTLIMRSLDDPMIDSADIPYDDLAANPYLHPVFPRLGGHVGFMEGPPARPTFWAERQAARFLGNCGLLIADCGLADKLTK